MSTQADFTPEEWTKLYQAPLVGGMGVSLADIGGPIEMSKESMAAMQAAISATDSEGLLGELSAALKGALSEHHNPMSDLKPDSGTDPRQMILDELSEANRIVTARATPEEAAGYRAWVVQSAKNAAEAAKEGGFFGIGAVQVSEGEQNFLAKVEAAMGETG